MQHAAALESPALRETVINKAVLHKLSYKEIKKLDTLRTIIVRSAEKTTVAEGN